MIDVAEHDLLTIQNLLEKYVPECEVRAFGSRVSWTAKDHSDLDLVIVGPEKINRKKLDQLKEAFEEAHLSFRVEVLDWHRVSMEFQKNIEKSFAVVKKPTLESNDTWRYFKVSEFAEVVGGGTPKTEVQEYWNGNIPWITPRDLSDHQGRYIAHGDRNITEKGLKNSSARIVPANTVLLTSRAPVGYLAIAQNPITTNQGFRSLVIKEGFSPEFIYYLLLNSVEYLKQHASGSTFQELSGGTLKNLDFRIPDLSLQNSIAKILSDLDAKIELNQQMNKTLEAMAQALFKQWFVDFRFPGYEKTNFLNGLPNGWQIEKMENLIDTVSATHKLKKDKIIFLNTSDVLNGEVLHQNYAEVPTLPGQAKKSIRINDILYSEIRPENKRFAYVDFDADDYVVSTKLMVLRAKGSVQPLVIYYFLKSEKIIDELQMLAESRSGTFPQITFENIRNLKMVVPSKEILDLYAKILTANFNKIRKNSEEIRYLSQIRDSLLPRLVTGELAIRHRNG